MVYKGSMLGAIGLALIMAELVHRPSRPTSRYPSLVGTQ